MIKKQRGVTLIEIMISMMLGLALVAGISQLFIQSQKSFKLQQNISDMTDDGAFILESLAKGVLLAGFADKPDPALFPEDLNVLSVSGVPSINFSAGESIHGTDTQLIFRYKLGYGVAVNDGTIIDDACKKDKNPPKRNGACELDNFVGTGALTGTKDDMVTVRIYKKDDTTPPTPVLYSKSKVNSTVDDAQPLISEVEKLEFRYGVKKLDLACAVLATPTIPGYCFYYTDDATVTLDDNWTKVFAVKVFLVLRSADDNLVRNQMGYKIDGVPPTSLPKDKRLYKVFSKTIFLRAPTQ